MNRPKVPNAAISRWEIAKPKEIVLHQFGWLVLSIQNNKAPGTTKAIIEIPTFIQMPACIQDCQGQNHKRSHPSKRTNTQTDNFLLDIDFIFLEVLFEGLIMLFSESKYLLSYYKLMHNELVKNLSFSIQYNIGRFQGIFS